MAEDGHRVPIRPRSGVFSVFEAVDYKAWYALAEFVDNSIQSWLTAQKSAGDILTVEPLNIFIETISGDNGYIRIRDNAAGIPLNRFDTAFEVGSPPPDPSGLSVYGIGMKSAGAWFAENFQIRTTTAGDGIERIVEYNFPKIVENGLDDLEWQEQPVDPNVHGTEVLLTALRNPIHTKTHGKVRSHLTSIYRNFIRDGVVRIHYQGERLQYDDPEILRCPDMRNPEGAAILWRKEIHIVLSTGEEVRGFAAVRKVGRAAGSGFSLYRQNRVITGLDDDPWRPREIFGLGNSYRSQRIFGELHLENVKVAYSKNGFVWQASEEELIEVLRRELDADPLPLLKQAEAYRARDPEPRQRQAAKKALQSATDAIKRAVEKDLAARIEATPESRIAAAISDSNKQLDQTTLDLTFSGYKWRVNVQLVEEEGADWLDLSDSGVPQVDGQRRLMTIRLNIHHPFMRRYGGTDAPEMDAIFRVAAAIGLSIVVARDQGVLLADAVLDHVNSLLEQNLAK